MTSQGSDYNGVEASSTLLSPACRLLVALLPQDFREGFGADISLTFDQAVRAMRVEKGAAAALLHGVVMLVDIGRTVVAERHLQVRQRIGTQATLVLLALIAAAVIAPVYAIPESSAARIVMLSAVTALIGLAFGRGRMWWLLLSLVVALAAELVLALLHGSLPAPAQVPPIPGSERFRLGLPPEGPARPDFWSFAEMMAAISLATLLGLAIGCALRWSLSRSSVIAAMRFPRLQAGRRQSI